MMAMQQEKVMYSKALPKSTIVLTVHSAKNLLALNRNHSSNPFIRISVGENQSAATPVQHKTCNPCYNCTFAFEDCQLPTTITIEVQNKVDYLDVEEAMGMVCIRVSDVCNESMKEVPLHCGNNFKLARQATRMFGSICISYAVATSPVAMQHCCSSTPHAAQQQEEQKQEQQPNKNNNINDDDTENTISSLPPSAPSLSLMASAANNMVNCAASPAHALPWPQRSTNTQTNENNNRTHIVAQEPFAQLHELVAKSPQPQRSFAHPPMSTSPSSTSLACLSQTSSDASLVSSSSSSFADLHEMHKSSVYSEMFVGTESCPPSLIPPSLTPAKVPVNLSYLFPDSAPVPPIVQTHSLNMKHKASKLHYHRHHPHPHHHHHPQKHQQNGSDNDYNQKRLTQNEECNNVPVFVSYAVPVPPTTNGASCQ